MKTSISFKLLIICTAIAVLLSSCAPTPTPVPFPGISTPTIFTPINVSVNAAKSDAQRIDSPMVSSDDFKMLVNGNNEFALDLYQAVRSTEGNFMFSPYSISLALAMAYAGARGETETQMAETLHYNLPQEKITPCF